MITEKKKVLIENVVIIAVTNNKTNSKVNNNHNDKTFRRNFDGMSCHSSYRVFSVLLNNNCFAVTRSSFLFEFLRIIITYCSMDFNESRMS